MKQVRWSTLFYRGFQWPKEPFVFIMKAVDIPETMRLDFANIPKHCIAVACYTSYPRHMAQIERIARHNDVRMLWVVRGPWARLMESE